jgi:N-acetyl-anhydromuramyl-L-alanine amidase AmpD
VMSGDPDAFAMGLKKDRYYTADEAEYAAGVRGRFQFYWVHLAQTLLVAAGYPLKVDGFGGRETSGAIARFQTATPGLQVTGAISVSTMAALQAAWPVPDAPDTLPEIEATLPNA